MQHTANSDGKVGNFQNISDVFFFCVCYIVPICLLVELSVSDVLRQFFLSFGFAVTLCIDTIFGTPFSSNTNIFDCTLMIWGSVLFRL